MFFVGVHMPFQSSPEKSSEAGLESPHPILTRDLVQVAEKWNSAECSAIAEASC